MKTCLKEVAIELGLKTFLCDITKEDWNRTRKNQSITFWFEVYVIPARAEVLICARGENFQRRDLVHFYYHFNISRLLYYIFNAGPVLAFSLLALLCTTLLYLKMYIHLWRSREIVIQTWKPPETSLLHFLEGRKWDVCRGENVITWRNISLPTPVV